MKRILLTLAFLFAASLSAAAQGCGPQNPNCIVPTAPAGTSDNRAASTAFVQNAVTTSPISSAQLDAICGTNNRSLIRLSGVWQCEAYSTQFAVGSTLSIANLSWGLITGTPTTLAGYGITNARAQLTGNVSYYVNGNSGGTATCGAAGSSNCAVGNDSNNCLTPATACLTLQHVFGLVLANVDLAYQYSVAIYLAHNTGTTNYDLSCVNGPWIGSSVISVTGDSSAGPSVTVITDPPLGYGLSYKDLCTIAYNYVSFADNGTNNGSGHITGTGTGNAGHLDFGNINLGPMTVGTMLSVGAGQTATASGPITITGGANAALSVSNGGFLDFGSATVTVTGTPAFGTAFAFMINGGSIGATSSTFSGSATGPRCIVDGPLNLGGYDPNNVFPGNTSCVQNEYIGAIGIQNGASFDYGASGKPLCSGGSAAAKDVWCTLSVGAGGTGQTTVAGIRSVVAPGVIYYILPGVNFNSGTTDNAIPLINFPAGMTRFTIASVFISNASHTLTTATAGLFTSTSGGGFVSASDQALTVSTSADATNGNAQQLAINTSTGASFVLANLVNTPNIYFRVGTPEGALAIADVTVIIRPLP